MDKSIIDRFWSKVDKNGKTMPHMTTPCWEWIGCRIPKGYGQIYYKGKMLLVHRVVMGCPEGLLVLHKCDNPPCCRPDHLFVGTQKDNLMDASRKGRYNNGGENNNYSKITEKQARKVVELLGTMEHKYISEITGASIPTIRGISRGSNWKHIPRKT